MTNSNCSPVNRSPSKLSANVSLTVKSSGIKSEYAADFQIAHEAAVAFTEKTATDYLSIRHNIDVSNFRMPNELARTVARHALQELSGMEQSTIDLIDEASINDPKISNRALLALENLK